LSIALKRKSRNFGFPLFFCIFSNRFFFLPGALFFFCRLKEALSGAVRALFGQADQKKDAPVPEKGSCGAFYGIRKAFAAPGHPRKYSGSW
jgi:hypothetical protein